MDLAPLSRRDTTNHVCAIVNSLFAVEGALFAGKTLANYFSGFSDLEMTASRRVAPPDTHIGRAH